MIKSVVAVILGGGAGSRLSPLTSTRSKPAVPIAGKYRLVDIPISNCLNSDIGRMYPDASSNFSDSTQQLTKLLQLTKAWRTKRGVPSKIGLYQFPHLPKDPYVAWGLSGGSVVALQSSGWNDTVFPKGTTLTNDSDVLGGFFGWYTPEETANLKNRIRLEYRKRYEPVGKECEVVMPEIFDYRSSELQSDTTNEYYKAWHKEILNLAFDLKTKRAWGVVFGEDNPPALENADIIPLITPVYMGTSVTGGISFGDPFTLQTGTLFDHDKINFNSIDWIRDEYLRPPGRTPAKIQGMSVWNPYLGRGLSANRTPVSADFERLWVNKWLNADSGLGLNMDIS